MPFKFGELLGGIVPFQAFVDSSCGGIVKRHVTRAMRVEPHASCYAPPLIGGALSDDARLTSVWRLTSVAYIGPKSRTERPRKTKIGTEVAHITCDSDTTFKVKRSKVKVTRPLCSPPCWRVRRLQRWAWERVGPGKLLLRCRLLGGAIACWICRSVWQ